jgi:hypothetical protein
MARTIIADPQKPLSVAQWRRWEQVALKPTLELDELVLNWVNPGVTDLDARGAVVSINVERTIEGGSSVTMMLSDPDHRLFAGRRVRTTDQRTARALYRRDPVTVDEGWDPMFGPNLISRAMEVELDGVVFRLVKVRASQAAQTIELTFEDRLVYWLKRKRGARRATRGSCTRAEFVLSLLQEVGAARGLYRFVCPELHVRQPIDSGVKSTATTSASTAARQTSDVPRALNTTYPAHHIGTAGAKHLSERQVRAAAELAGLSPTDALHAAQIAHGESDFYPGVVQDDPGNGMVGHGLWQMTPHAWGGTTNATYRHMQSLGGLSAMRNPIQAARQMKWMHDQAKGWGPWYGTRYLDLSARASGSVLADGQTADAGDTSEGGAQSSSYAKSYQFARSADENSWEAMQRLAGEVGWRCFVVGNSLYYMSEAALYGRRVRYEVTPDDPAMLDLTYDVDWGKRTSECELDVALDRWGAAPGSVVTLDGFGVPDGRWLVTGVSRDYFATNASVTLKQPGKALLEPANERVTRASNASSTSADTQTPLDDGTKAGKLYAECKRISDAGGTYVYGGGHGAPLVSLSSGQGLDCSSSTSLALHRAGMFNGTTAYVSGQFAREWGEPGRGERFTVWANDGHVWIQLHGIGNAWRFDTSPYGSGGRGPRLRTTPRPTDGFTPRHWKGV